MVKQLSFKGDKKPKKRKRQTTEVDDDDDADSAALTQAPPQPTDDHEDDSWVSAEAAADVAGPVIIVLPTSPITCIASDANSKIFTSEVENMAEGDPATAEPHDVRQVWVANRVAGSETLSLKGHHGMYLSCDKFGIVSATKEAISPEESFLCVPAPDSPGTFALQTQREGFVTVGEATKETRDIPIRGDAETIGFNQTFRIRMQARFKPKLKVAKEEKAKGKISRKELEEAAGRGLNDDEVKTLKRARRDGTYHEAILDVKVKSKHDKFA